MTMMRGVLGGFGRPEADPIPSTMSDYVCEATLPSSSAVDALYNGDPWAIPAVLLSTALRGCLIGAGAYVAGVRGVNVGRAAVGGALGIEAFVIGYVGWQKWQDAKARAAAKPATP
jgi:hypothetical protein